ncbi:Asp-tRNA(Asn)/Glu-tRNA(Gln) amidotransferase subunit GatB [Candidatus Pacearchaeota archaeon]|nr:Asp-tRNA(Asn)/Glu-tRNA(Gln) amidotransferase subunit GatB [Candidatus Pacearchaeota archaeon]
MEGTIGLEIHTYLVTKEKLFCRCAAKREKSLIANSFICPICTGQPGAKPMLPNKSAVEKAVKIALMLGCKINEKMAWQRKHYSWPDLPKGYQNTLSGPYATPVGSDGKFLGIGIWEMHLEEDPAAWDPETGRVDYNRSGLPLVEIVTAPDFSTSEEVKEWLGKLLHYLRYLKCVSSDAGIKVDVNVSVKGGARVEVKNVNSVDSIVKAIEFELERQSREKSVQETRRYDAAKNKTIVMRSKENAEDYRFISDPDLKDIILDKKFISEIEKAMPESPDVKLNKLIKKYKIGKSDAEVLAKHLEIVEFFEKVAEKIDGKFALHWITVELLRHLNYNKTSLDDVDIKVGDFVKLLEMVKSGRITELQGKEVLNRFYPASFDPTFEVRDKISDSDKLESVCRDVILQEKDAVLKYKNGDEKVLNFLIGQVMKKTEKRADFKVVKKVIEVLLK